MKVKNDNKFLKFDDYKIIGFNFNIKPEYLKEAKRELLIEIKSDSKIIDKNKFQLFLTVNVCDENNFLNIIVTSVGFFEFGDNIEKEQHDKLMKINAPAILFPFIRASLTSITAQMGIAPIILPTVNFTN
ncbi:MAG: protein-export chaperone SecB [Candidatus Muirbacterium halophilum]|nr:protein-export chaperone SecB [Candidatus Muirbacterium halophilum]MCK9474552.1 protein-export chaperone SecB [Candidatus Muirbacterium halophilum]